MDNCSIHHVAEVKNPIEDTGILLFFFTTLQSRLLSYRRTFSYLKYYLKEYEDLIQALPNPIPIIEAALDGVTSSKCNGWINDSDYDRWLVTACWYMVYNMTTLTYIYIYIYIWSGYDIAGVYYNIMICDRLSHIRNDNEFTVQNFLISVRIAFWRSSYSSLVITPRSFTLCHLSNWSMHSERRVILFPGERKWDGKERKWERKPVQWEKERVNVSVWEREGGGRGREKHG